MSTNTDEFMRSVTALLPGATYEYPGYIEFPDPSLDWMRWCFGLDNGMWVGQLMSDGTCHGSVTLDVGAIDPLFVVQNILRAVDEWAFPG
jgi:hypothetical protein